MPMSPRLLRPRASGTAFHAEAIDWASRVTANGGTVTTNTLAAVSTFCASIQAAGIRDRFYRLNLFCGDQLAAALVPLYRAESSTASVRGNTTDTNNGPFVAADFNNTGSSSGLAGNGTSKFLNTGYPANTLPASNTHIAIGLLKTHTGAAGDKTGVGTYDSGSTRVFTLDVRRPNGSGIRLFAMGSYGPFNSSFGPLGGTAGIGIGNLVASAGVSYRDGSAISDNGSPVLANYSPAHSFYVFAANNGAGGGASVNHTDARIGSYSIGADLTAAQVSAYHSALSAFNLTLSRT